MKREHCLIMVSVVLVFLNMPAEARVLKLDDFDRCIKPSLIGGDYGAWNKTEWDRSQYCNDSYTSDPRIVYDGKGCSLVLDYDVDSSGPAFNGFWMRLEKVDLTKYRHLSLAVKGDSRKGYTTRFKVEIKSIKGDIARFDVEGITSEWKEVRLPLVQIFKEGDFSEAYEFTIVFETTSVSAKIGRIYLDEIYLE
jgi:hypothetical protein